METSSKLWYDFHKVKDSAIQSIKEHLEQHNATHIDFTDCCNCPIILDGFCDENTYTLDDLRLENGKLKFYASSICDSIKGTEVSVSIEAVIDTLEVIEDYGDCIFENEDDE